VKGTVRQWEHEQSMDAGGEMQLRLRLDVRLRPPTSRARDPDRLGAATSSTRRRGTFTFSEIVTPDAGYVRRHDSNGRTKQSLDSNRRPIRCPGAAGHLAARTPSRSSLLLLEMQEEPRSRLRGRRREVGKRNVSRRQLPRGDQTFTVMFDRDDGVAARARTLDYDNIWGDVTSDVVLADWQTKDGLAMAFSRTYELNGRPVMEIKTTDVAVNTSIAPSSSRFAHVQSRGSQAGDGDRPV